MSLYQTSATSQATATAVSFAYASASFTTVAAMHAFTMWSSPTVKHANKRSTRQPCEVMN